MGKNRKRIFLLPGNLIFFLALIYATPSFSQLSLTLDPTNTTCGYPNGVIFAIVTGGTAPYSYSDNGGNFLASNLFSGLNAGSHTIVVQDATGATATTTVILTNDFPHPNFTVSAQTPPTNCNAFDGTLTIAASGGTAPYQYSTGDGNYQNGNIFNALTPGYYNLSVRDANNCYSSITYKINDLCPVGVNYTYTPRVCSNEGTLLASANLAGALPYTYSLDGINYTTNGSFTGLVSGFYHLYTKDANGLISINAFIIYQHCDLQVQADPQPSRCNNHDGSIAITVTGGKPPIYYSVQGRDYQTNNTILNLAPGSYTVLVKDANGNSGTQANVVIGNYCPVLLVSSTPTACTSNTGTIFITTSTGTAPIFYSIDGTNFQTGTTFTGLPAGNYTVTSKDAGNIITTTPITVETANAPALTLNSTDAGCTVNNGTIISTVQGGLAPYNYQLNTDPFQTSNIFTGVAVGNYIVNVQDANGCTVQAPATVNVTETPTLTLVTTNGGCSVSNGTITSMAIGGTLPYAYQLNSDPFQTSNVFTGLAGGNYIVGVKDANGCAVQTPATITISAAPTLAVSVSPETCIGKDGIISALVTGGTIPLLYNLNNGTAQASSDFTGLASGNYSLEVVDANGCSAQQPAVVSLTNSLTVDAGNNQSMCYGTNITLHANTAATNISWSPTQGLSDPLSTDPVASPNVTTLYYLNANAGICSAKDSVLVTVNTSPVANAGNDTIACYGEDLQLHGSGGTHYQWSPAYGLDNTQAMNPTVIRPLQSVTYQLMVSDDFGCSSSSPAFVTVNVLNKAVVFAGNDTSVQSGSPVTLHATDLSNSDFSSYQWTPSYGLNDPDTPNPTVTLSQDFTYSVTATNSAGCKATDDITIRVFKASGLFVPNAFTPNHDGINDVLHIVPIGMRSISYFALYNRRGLMVFKTENAALGWDGTYNGNQQPQDAYIWMAEGVDDSGKTIQGKGTVVLIR